MPKLHKICYSFKSSRVYDFDRYYDLKNYVKNLEELLISSWDEITLLEMRRYI